MPARKKPNGRQDNRAARSNVLALRPDDQIITVPQAPTGLLKATKERWEAFFNSDLAKAVEEVDLAALERLFRYYDQWARYEAIVRKKPTTEGSKGQVRANPLAQRMKDIEATITRLEDAFGITPLARMKLGIAVGTARLTAAEINRMAQENDGDRDGHEEEDVADAEVFEGFIEA